MSALEQRLQSALDSRASRQMLRALDPSPPSSSTLVDFSSNDYLSFSRSTVLRQKLVDVVNDDATPLYGPPSSRLLDGNTPLHASLERRLAAFFAAPSALLFNSGFDANVGLWTCLPGPDDWIIFDALVHASMHDGMRASRVPRQRRRAFRHNRVESLERVLVDIVERDVGVRKGEKSVWVGVESLYSMDGDLAPLPDMVEVLERLLPRGNGHMVVDEAHSSGLYGPRGRGLVSALELERRITVRVHTFGKAMACSGAAVLASPLIRHFLVNYARPLIYSTVSTHLSALAVSKSLEMLEEGKSDEPAAHVHALAVRLVSRLSSLLPPASSVSLPPHLSSIITSSSTATAAPHPPTSPIVPLLTPSPRPLAAFLRTRGFLARPITYPTVPRGEERLRVCLHAGNTQREVDGLCEAVAEWVRRGERGRAEEHVLARF
ncbi:pyridoxal phosphate-dependent transferase [Rhodotorula diobovata]|uniref:Pyridoxal phosphate-dependent transferase n=1 Tax=Rhodotorula diobovata TaxID=5288 RepID=A0A5C5FKP4_9BASI|nr:pyridoxal phosphate-dependent transferase [Rhodotorula diobovata]